MTLCLVVPVAWWHTHACKKAGQRTPPTCLQQAHEAEAAAKRCNAATVRHGLVPSFSTLTGVAMQRDGPAEKQGGGQPASKLPSARHQGWFCLRCGLITMAGGRGPGRPMFACCHAVQSWPASSSRQPKSWVFGGALASLVYSALCSMQGLTTYRQQCIVAHVAAADTSSVVALPQGRQRQRKLLAAAWLVLLPAHMQPVNKGSSLQGLRVDFHPQHVLAGASSSWRTIVA